MQDEPFLGCECISGTTCRERGYRARLGCTGCWFQVAQGGLTVHHALVTLTEAWHVAGGAVGTELILFAQLIYIHSVCFEKLAHFPQELPAAFLMFAGGKQRAVSMRG